MATPRDTARLIEVPGPWQHRHVAANGARFHVAELGPTGGRAASGPPGLVLFLHGFPEFWWSWRDQLGPTADAGFRAVAMDLRGYGGSDKTPRGYDPMTLAQDVVGVVKALGHRSGVVVGHGWGGYVGWTAATLYPQQVSALCSVSAPHPLAMLRDLRSRPHPKLLAHLLAMQTPWLPERRIADPAGGYVGAHLRAWSAPGSDFPRAEVAGAYQQALSLWPASHCALEYHRWLVRSRARADGRRFNALMRAPLSQPACSLYGELDPALDARPHHASADHVAGPFRCRPVSGTGHFPHEEDPDQFNGLLLDWLASL